MARWAPEQTVTQSVLERLIDREPEAGGDAPLTRTQSVRQLRAALRRDLEWLLNTRRTPEPAGPEYEELYASLFNYGLPDVTTLSRSSVRDRTRLVRMIEETVSTFEPRITRLKVTPVESASSSQHVLRFQIEGLLMMDPSPEHVSFDTVLQLSSGEYSVNGGPNAG